MQPVPPGETPADPRLQPHDAAPVKSPTEARQARPFHRVRYVLAVGIALVVIAFLAVYLWTPVPPPAS